MGISCTVPGHGGHLTLVKATYMTVLPSQTCGHAGPVHNEKRATAFHAGNEDLPWKPQCSQERVHVGLDHKSR
jgi:hypothetical protein